MSMFCKDFDYMPPGSFYVVRCETLKFRDESGVTPEQKERMLAEWPDYVKRMKEKHARGEYHSSDMVM